MEEHKKVMQFLDYAERRCLIEISVNRLNRMEEKDHDWTPTAATAVPPVADLDYMMKNVCQCDNGNDDAMEVDQKQQQKPTASIVPAAK